jgi:S-formylglutathione hydrolase FrmB
MRALVLLPATGASLCVLAASIFAQQPPAPDAPAPKSAAADETSPKGRMEYFKLASSVLKQELEVGVWLPPGYDSDASKQQRFPVLYFLHGLFGTSHKWQERATDGTLERMISRGEVGPMIVVCPDGKNSMYVNAIDGGGDWGDFLATELVETIDGKYRTLEDRVFLGINGDSMGGYGALNVAFKHPDVFGSVSAHSAAIYPVDPEQLPDRIKGFAQQWKPVYDWPIDVKHWKEWNPLELAATVPAETLQSLQIYFDCGDQDRFGFNKTNQELHDTLEKRGVKHEWHLRSGGHGRDYFSEYAHESMRFHGDVFAAAAKAEGKTSTAAGKSSGSGTH